MRSSSATLFVNAADQPGDEDGTKQRGADGGAELLGGVLDAARLAAVGVPDRRLDHVPELGDRQPHPGPEHAHRHQECRGVDRGLDHSQEHEGREQNDDEAGPHQCPRGEPRGQPRADERGDEQAHRRGQHPHPGLERVESLHDLQVEREP